MSTFLTLGTVVFSNFEIPERINFGGDQALAVHQLVGGKRVIDSLGRLDDDISWSGLMFESTATFRAQFLDQMRVQGLPLNLTWGQFNYQVVIKSFKASFERTYQIPYSITVTVIQDLNKPLPVIVPVAYNDAIIGMMAEANDLSTVINNPSVSNAMTLLSAAINDIPNFDSATSAELATIVVPLAFAQSAVTSALTALMSSTSFL